MTTFASHLSSQNLSDDGQPSDSLVNALKSRKAEQRRYTIFLIEDDISDKNQIMQILLRSPYVHNVHWFTSGDALMRHFTEAGYYSANLIHKIPTMVLLDLHIPGLDGMHILQQLKDHPLTTDIPVIMISGDSSNESASAAFQLKANAYVTKPIHLDRIHEVIETGWGWPAHPVKSGIV